jgi:hypothetical protein
VGHLAKPFLGNGTVIPFKDEKCLGKGGNKPSIPYLTREGNRERLKQN